MDVNELESKQLMLSWQISLMNFIQLFFNILPTILLEIMVSSLDGTLEKTSYYYILAEIVFYIGYCSDFFLYVTFNKDFRIIYFREFNYK